MVTNCSIFEPNRTKYLIVRFNNRSREFKIKSTIGRSNVIIVINNNYYLLRVATGGGATTSIPRVSPSPPWYNFTIVHSKWDWTSAATSFRPRRSDAQSPTTVEFRSSMLALRNEATPMLTTRPPRSGLILNRLYTRRCR